MMTSCPELKTSYTHREAGELVLVPTDVGTSYAGKETYLLRASPAQDKAAATFLKPKRHEH